MLILSQIFQAGLIHVIPRSGELAPIEVAERTIRQAPSIPPKLKIDDFHHIRNPKELLNNPAIKKLADQFLVVGWAYAKLEAQVTPSRFAGLIDRLKACLPSCLWLSLQPSDPVDRFVKTAEEGVTLFELALRANNPEAACVLLDWGFDLTQFPRETLEQVTCLAGQRGWGGLLDKMLAHDPTLINATHNGHTLLTTVLAKKHVELAKQLVAQGAKVDREAALLAFEGADRELAKEVLSRIDWKEMQFELIERVIKSGDPSNIQLLNELGVDLNVTNSKGETPLHIAAKQRGKEAAMELVFLEAAIDVQDSEGRTPLMVAADRGHLDTIALLLNKGADTNLKDGGGKTLLEQVDRSRNIMVRSFFYEHQELWKERTTIPWSVSLERWKTEDTPPEPSPFSRRVREIEFNIAGVAFQKENWNVFFQSLRNAGLRGTEQEMADKWLQELHRR